MSRGTDTEARSAMNLKARSGQKATWNDEKTTAIKSGYMSERSTNKQEVGKSFHSTPRTFHDPGSIRRLPRMATARAPLQNVILLTRANTQP